jgi:hypothetical protein
MRLCPVSFVVSAVTVLALAGCGDSSSTGGTSSTGSSGGTCAPGTGCPSVKSDCIGLVDNSGKSQFTLRMSHLTVQKPAALTDLLVKSLLDLGVSLNLASCNAETGDPLFPSASMGTAGAFSWLLQFDTTTGKLKTGGATPEADPTKGYCFVNSTVNGFNIAPFEVDAPISGGKFAIQMPKDVVVPVYSDISATTVILLPLRGVRIHDATISSDNNCIGKFNASGLLPSNSCLPAMDTPQYIDGASLDGFVTLEDADKVLIDQLGKESLCLLLSGNAKMWGDATGKLCARDPGTNKIKLQGDWCSTTNAAADASCADAISLGATFAASSVAMKSSCP